MLAALGKEILMRKNELVNEVDTIYFGGGTPSLLTANELDSILNLIQQNFKLSPEAEITLEANPDDLTLEKIKELSSSPINRLSIGVQSFLDRDLKYMNRAHDAFEARKSSDDALKFFENISIDLIYGLPDLTEDEWEMNLNEVFKLGIPHISSYALTVEPKTALDHFIKSGKSPAPSEQLAEKHFNYLQKATKELGFQQYEISNFGKPGFYSKHNTSYWKGIAYLGIGPSAHSYDGYSRSWNIANNAKYMASIQKDSLPSEKEKLTPENQINENIMTGLRTMWGLSLSSVREKHGEIYVEKILSNAHKYLSREVLFFQEDRLFLRPESYFLADGISADLFLL